MPLRKEIKDLAITLETMEDDLKRDAKACSGNFEQGLLIGQSAALGAVSVCLRCMLGLIDNSVSNEN